MSMSINKYFLYLVKLGIKEGNVNLFQSFPLYDENEWRYIEDLADHQGLSAVIVDGINHLPKNFSPPKNILLSLIGKTIQGYENRYDSNRRVIAEMAGFYRERGLKMMVLKGYACSLDWPKPEHRPCGDIDIWQFGKQKEGDALIEKEKKIKVDNSHHHHTVYYWRDFMVENHYDFVNIHDRRSSFELEKIFKELGADDSHYMDVCGERVYLPSPNLHALFLIRHLVSHFAAAEITLRQVLDWAFFVDKHTKEIDWNWLVRVLDKYHMKDFFNLINAICVDDLGFKTDVFPEVRFMPELKERVLKDILDPAYGAAEPNRFFPRIAYKYRRWQGNAWKQELCYSESRWESFWTGFWAHLLKPSSI